jgi:hypothetical protein
MSRNFVLQQLCEKKLYGNQIPGRGFTAPSGERCVSPFSAIDYRRYAAECVRLAQSTSDPVDKARLDPVDKARLLGNVFGVGGQKRDKEPW